MKTLTLYTRENAPSCDGVRTVLLASGLPFREIHFGTEDHPHARIQSIPFVVIDVDARIWKTYADPIDPNQVIADWPNAPASLPATEEEQRATFILRLARMKRLQQLVANQVIDATDTRISQLKTLLRATYKDSYEDLFT